MDAKEYASAYAIARTCGFNQGFDDFRKLYDQYYSEAIEAIPEKPQLAKVEVVSNPFRNRKNF